MVAEGVGAAAISVAAAFSVKTCGGQGVALARGLQHRRRRAGVAKSGIIAYLVCNSAPKRRCFAYRHLIDCKPARGCAAR